VSEKSTTVYIFCPFVAEQFNPVAIYKNCTDVEVLGTVLTFTDDKGVFHKTTLAWEIEVAFNGSAERRQHG